MFKTRDLFLASTLVLKGHSVQNHEREGNICYFYFKDTEDLKNLVQGYLYDKITVSPVKFQSAIKSVKTIVYS
ncbi:DUF5659 domain-containing protein [candidate division KSB1 bacterium]